MISDAAPRKPSPDELREWARDDFGISLTSVEAVDAGADIAADVWRAEATDGARYAVKHTAGGSGSGQVITARLAAAGVTGVPAPLRSRHSPSATGGPPFSRGLVVTEVRMPPGRPFRARFAAPFRRRWWRYAPGAGMMAGPEAPGPYAGPGRHGKHTPDTTRGETRMTDTSPHDTFRAARDTLLRHREDYDAARADFVWPRPEHFN